MTGPRSDIERRRQGDAATKSEGNGVAIRVAPLAIANRHRGDDELIALVEENGRATHDSDAAIRAAAFIALLIRRAVTCAPGALSDVDTLREVMASASEVSGFELGLSAVDADACDADACDATFVARLREVGTSGHVQQCVRAVALVLLRHRLDFPAAMRSVFRAGGDTDSIGAMVGAVIGAQLGCDGLPSEWAGVQHRDYLCWLADRLAQPRETGLAKGDVDCVVGNVATRPVDVVVNAWNRNAIPPWLLLPQGVSRAIRRAGGGETLRKIGRRAPLPLGTASETTSSRLVCTWVIHAAGIDLTWRASKASVVESTRSALLLARWLGARSVALPLIGAGSGGLERDFVRVIMLEELANHRDSFDYLERVIATERPSSAITRGSTVR